MSLSFSGESFERDQMALTIGPSNRLLSTSSSAFERTGFSSGFVTRSTETPLQPLRGPVGEVGLEPEGIAKVEGRFSANRRRAFTLAKNTAS